MCGHVALIDLLGGVDLDELSRRIKLIAYRGPDDEGCWRSADGRVGLASCRLAIQDLSAAGHMPMNNPSGDVIVTFNGEIYNFRDLRRQLETHGYRFRGQSDTEVLLNAYIEWGEDCLQQLEGMLSFVIYDGRPEASKCGKVFFARDRAGEKPLYYYPTPTGLAIASELKALTPASGSRLAIDPAGFNAYLALGYVPPEWCILRGYHKLPAAHAGIFDLASGDLRTWRYWRLPGAWQGRPASDQSERFTAEVVGELRRRLLASVASRLVSDVPVGILLSGGLDSSLITAAAAHVAPASVKTFTVVFPGSGDFDEGPQARCIARHFGTAHHEIQVEDDLHTLIPMLARQLDEPLGDSSIVPTYVVAREARKHVSVALSGDGGDELFGGYMTYDRAIRLQTVLSRPVTRLPRALIADLAARLLPLHARGRRYLSSVGNGPREQFIQQSLQLDYVARKQILSAEYLPQISSGLDGPERFRRRLMCQAEGDLATRMMMADFQSYLVDDVLFKVDRASMACSLETRAPWLDSGLIEFAYSAVPSKLKVAAGQRKIILKHLASEMLPPGLDVSTKRGFSLPRSMWVSQRWTTFARDSLMGISSNVYNTRSIINLLQRAVDGNARAAGCLFPLVMFENWRRACGATY